MFENDLLIIFIIAIFFWGGFYAYKHTAKNTLHHATLTSIYVYPNIYLTYC